MYTRNHYELAKRIADAPGFEPLKKHRLLFMLGNIMPDINLLTYFVGHNAKERLPLVEKRLEKLMHQKASTALGVFLLGTTLHYAADCFTLPHNEGYQGNMGAHLQYEKELMPRIRTAIAAPHKDAPQARLSELHTAYLKEQEGEETDCAYICAATFAAAGIVAQEWEAAEADGRTRRAALLNVS